MKQTVIIGVGVLVVVGGLFFLLTTQDNAPAPSSLTETEIETTQPTTTSETVTASPETDTSVLRAGGSSYSHPTYGYTFLYPNEYSIDTEDQQYIRIYKRGEAQRAQSEMSDGVLMVFESVDLKEQTLEQLVDARIAQATADGTSEVIKPKQRTVLNGYPGYSYELRGMGSATYLVIQKSPESSSALSITYVVMDPQQLGYEAEVTSVLSTIELQK